MVTRWEQGRPVLDRLIAEGRLDRVVANPTLAGQYLAQAHSDSDSARMLLPHNTVAAFTLAYDVGRLSLTSLLIVQGLRARGEGAHAVLLESALAQFEPPRQSAFREFQWMRRMRNDNQYPEAGVAKPAHEDVALAISASDAIWSRCSQLVGILTPY